MKIWNLFDGYQNSPGHLMHASTFFGAGAIQKRQNMARSALNCYYTIYRLALYSNTFGRVFIGHTLFAFVARIFREDLESVERSDKSKHCLMERWTTAQVLMFLICPI